MDAGLRVSAWSVQEVLDWMEARFPELAAVLQKAIIKHEISGRALLRLKDHHLELLGVEAPEQQQELLQYILLLRVQEETQDLSDICGELFST